MFLGPISQPSHRRRGVSNKRAGAPPNVLRRESGELRLHSLEKDALLPAYLVVDLTGCPCTGPWLLLSPISCQGCPTCDRKKNDGETRGVAIRRCVNPHQLRGGSRLVSVGHGPGCGRAAQRDGFGCAARPAGGTKSARCIPVGRTGAFDVKGESHPCALRRRALRGVGCGTALPARCIAWECSVRFACGVRSICRGNGRGRRDVRAQRPRAWAL